MSAVSQTVDRVAKNKISTIEDIVNSDAGNIKDPSEIKDEHLISDLVSYYEEAQGREEPAFMLGFKSGLIIATYQTKYGQRDVIRDLKTRMETMGYPAKGAPKLATHQMITSYLSSQIAERKKKKGRAKEALTEAQIEARVIIKDARQAGASDIHIYLYEDKPPEMYYRVGGYMKNLVPPAKDKLSRIIASLFNVESSSNELFNDFAPEDAKTDIDLNENDENKEPDIVSLRLAKSGMDGGLIFVARLLGAGELLKLHELDFDRDQEYLIREATNYPNGAVLVSGPTGSGKTNTLAAAILHSDHQCKSTIEDPVEIKIPGVRQAAVNHRNEKMSFSSLIVAKLREDVDLLSVGEVRDEKTASAFMDMALTGHLCMGSIHTNSATETILRLSEIDVRPSIMANTLRLLISQRLIAKVCPHCGIIGRHLKDFEEGRINKPKKPRYTNNPEKDKEIDRKYQEAHKRYHRLAALSQNYSKEAKKVFYKSFESDLGTIQLRNVLGCEHCSKGRKGRALVAEVVKVDEEGKKFILNLDTPEWNKYLATKGFKNIKDRARRKIVEGVIDPFDANLIITGIFEENNFQFDYSALENLLSEDSKPIPVN